MNESDFSPVRFVGHEVRTDSNYYWNNRGRNSPPRLLLQRTLAGACFFEDASGRRLVPPGHAMIFTFDEDSTYGYPEEASEPYRHVFLTMVAGRCVQPFFDAIRDRFGAVVRMRDKGEANRIFQELIDQHERQLLVDEIQATELLVRLFHAIYREQMEAGGPEEDPISKGHALIQTHFASPLSLKALAVKCGVSREHFIRRFRRRYGTSPAVLLRTIRLEHARQALVFSRLSVEEIARDCGFTGANSFCRAFRRHYGVSPLQDRAGVSGAFKQRARRRA